MVLVKPALNFKESNPHLQLPGKTAVNKRSSTSFPTLSLTLLDPLLTSSIQDLYDSKYAACNQPPPPLLSRTAMTTARMMKTLNAIQNTRGEINWPAMSLATAATNSLSVGGL